MFYNYPKSDRNKHSFLKSALLFSFVINKPNKKLVESKHSFYNLMDGK